MLIALSAPEWTAVAALASALAASASWAAVWQARTIWRSSLLPHLQGQVNYESDGRLLISVHNAGGGLAVGSMVVCVAGGTQLTTALGTGFLRSDERMVIRTNMFIPTSDDPDDDGVKLGLFCRDIDQRSYGWNRRGEPRKFRRTRRKPFHTVGEMFRAFYPDVGDLNTLGVAQFQLTKSK